MNQPYTLVTQSFGREYEYRRAILTILSYYSCTKEAMPTLLFTDQPEYFKPYLNSYPVQYVLLTPEKIKLMRGEIDFLHRMKIALIEEAFEKASTNILYADSDTFFLKSPQEFMDKISVNQSYMHIHEYVFNAVRNMSLPAGRFVRKFIEYIETENISIPHTSIRINASMSSWNAGVMLIALENKTCIPDVYALTDLFYKASQSHASEQYAFSIMLQTLGNLDPVDSVIYHYWYNVKKKIIDSYLQEHLDKLRSLSNEEKQIQVLNWINVLPQYFDSHVETYKDNAIQHFDASEYTLGFKNAGKAFYKGAWREMQFIKDVLYHTKRFVLKK